MPVALPSYRVFGLSVSAQEAVLALFWMLTLSQALYLASRNITLQGGLFAWHRDEFMFGSGHNPSVPGNFGIRDERSLGQRPLGATAIASADLGRRHRDRDADAAPREQASRSRCSRSTSCARWRSWPRASGLRAAGARGVLLPAHVPALPDAVRGQAASGRRCACTLICVGMPWFVAMFIRHGPAFTDRILVHDHINRLTKGVHGDTGTVQYFIEQLGYGMFRGSGCCRPRSPRS